MAFDASGTFTRTAGSGADGSQVWQDDAAAGTRILASRHDTHDQDLASGLSQCLTRHGWGVPSVDIPWGGKKITNLAKPTALNDAANKDYVDNPDPAQHARAIAGADLDGRLNFTAPSGVNGITWTYADLAWVARGATVGEANNRLVLSDTKTPDTTGPAAGLADVFIIDEVGRINAQGGRLTHNVSYDGATVRTISPGRGLIVGFTGGTFSVSSNDVATITNNYAAMTPRTFFEVQSLSGDSVMTLQKSGTSSANRIKAMNGVDDRWTMDLGNNTTETGGTTGRGGSDFYLYSYQNDGQNPVAEIAINRATHKVTFSGEVSSTAAQSTMGSSTAGSAYTMQRPINSGSFNIYGGTTSALGAYLSLYGETHTTNGGDIVLGTDGDYRYFYDYSAGRHYWANNTGAVMDLATTGDLSITGQLNVDSIVQSTDATLILASATSGAIYFRCNGAANAAEEVNINTTGDLILQTKLDAATGGVWAGRGVMGKVGWQGAYGSYHQNFNWNGSVLTAYANASIIGNLSYTVSDYRLKKDITPLASMWNAVKALKPIRYTQRAYDVWTEDDTPRLGFLAHELRESIDEGAVLGEKDGPDVQFINPMAVIAALTKALQEAMLRIEALEAA